MTQAEAIKVCQGIWAKIRKSGLTKQEFFKQPRFSDFYSKYRHNCPLCEWVSQGPDFKIIPGAFTKGCMMRLAYVNMWCYERLRICPLIKQYGLTCEQLGFEESSKNHDNWFKTVRNLKLQKS